ncbi:hypothetical protein NKR23_g6158 [Pleurostoma richardsiae]|uniref:Uncharacterized protein n=1 Tax=Pleurostoma richardsiae TaxID=41990 RepID=A0AA38RLZ5_9PEZI|nr:hypothetical protein NKR23_g6158 [Pleurostoma richardsiae]
MKFLVTATALLSTALAGPVSSLRFAKRQSCDPTNDPSIDSVSGAITNWLHDVQTVNSFLDNVPPVGSTALQQAAQNTLQSANDEPNELSILASICELNPGDPPYAQAVLLLQEVFGNVPTNLQKIIDNFGDAGTVATSLQVINNVRCCNVLPALDVIWLTAAEDYGLVGSVTTDVPRPNSCSTVQC